MTEEIIIDGVNVVECPHRKKEVTFMNVIKCYNYGACEGVNCLYKQLKRLEQERDELKKQNAILLGQLVINDGEDVTVQISQSQFDEYNELKQENKELKEWKNKVVKLFESACRCKYLNEETDICSYTNEKCININKCVYKYQGLSNTYRSVLEEINKIAEPRFVNGLNEEADQYNQCMDRIQNKINEVLGC